MYDTIKIAISNVLDSQKVSGLTIDSEFSPSSTFNENVLALISQNRAGSFYGSDEARRLLAKLCSEVSSWSDFDSIEEFLNSLIELLENDKRDPRRIGKTFIGDIVKERDRLYELIFSLKFLETHYELKQNNKSIDNLSPGEKGALLLVFYLVLDQDDTPLVIDQPEDNLDNFSIATFLVPFIQSAKKRRQIIMVTHNPNLAVVADSEQIIRTSIDKVKGNQFDFCSGGIEQKEIRDEIVKVLEGDKPAFKTRKDKYGNLDSI